MPSKIKQKKEYIIKEDTESKTENDNYNNFNIKNSNDNYIILFVLLFIIIIFMGLLLFSPIVTQNLTPKEYINCEDEYIFEYDKNNRKISLLENGIKTDLTVMSFSDYNIYAGIEKYFDKEEYKKCVNMVVSEAKKRGENINRCIWECGEGEGIDFEKEFTLDRVKGTMEVCGEFEHLTWDDDIKTYTIKPQYSCKQYKCIKQNKSF